MHIQTGVVADVSACEYKPPQRFATGMLGIGVSPKEAEHLKKLDKGPTCTPELMSKFVEHMKRGEV